MESRHALNSMIVGFDNELFHANIPALVLFPGWRHTMQTKQQDIRRLVMVTQSGRCSKLFKSSEEQSLVHFSSYRYEV